MDAELAYHIYTILIEECGASDRTRDREDFIAEATQSTFSEYRFCGNLGFGGKFYKSRSKPHWYVSLYPEDRTPVRDETVSQANKRLS